VTDNKTKGVFRVLWPAISDRESAEAAADQGVGVALFSAVANIIVIWFGVATNDPIMGIGLASLIDVALLLFLAALIGVNRSRVAAIFGLAYFVINNVVLRIAYFSTSGIVIALLFATFWLNSVRGTIACQSVIRAERTRRGDEAPRSNRY